jgi:glucose-6-phosphate dehydrogenase assembly protein OpcA
MSSAVAIRPEQLLKDLAGLWTQLGKEETEGSDRSAGVLRAVTMTFLLGVEEGDDEAAASEALAQLMHEHPARAIVLKLAKDSSSPIDAKVLAQCWMPFGRRQQICCEQIELSAGADAFGGVLSLLHGLAAPDLPVIFWCRSARVFTHPAFADIAGLAQKVIVDSRKHPDPQLCLNFLAQQTAAGHLYGDLSWARLTRWRESVSNVFERMDCRGFFQSLTQARIKYSSPTLPVAAIYLRAWLKSVLGSQLDVQLLPEAVSEPWQIRELRFVTALTDVVIERSARGLVETHIQNFSSRTVFEVLDEARLVREEIAILGPDPIFARTLQFATRQ